MKLKRCHVVSDIFLDHRELFLTPDFGKLSARVSVGKHENLRIFLRQKIDALKTVPSMIHGVDDIDEKTSIFLQIMNDQNAYTLNCYDESH